jgi:hypothetical protein
MPGSGEAIGEKERKKLSFLSCMLFLMSGSSLMAQDGRYNFDSKADSRM